MIRISSILRLILGTLLLAAAGLKLYGLSISALPRVGWFAESWVQVAVAEWEIVLGLWLISGATPFASWLAAVATFLAFAGVSAYLGAVGVASCGCFGTIHASPWWAFAVDVAAIVLLIVGRPRRSESSSTAVTQPAREGLKWLGGTAAILIVLTVAASIIYGSPDAALARLCGESLSVADSYLDFGSGKPGESLEASAMVHNWTDHPVRIVGGTSDCSCTTLGDLPVMAEPGGSVGVRIVLKVPGSAQGHLTRTVLLRTDCPEQPGISFRIGCRIE